MQGLDLTPRFVADVQSTTGLNKETLQALVVRFIAEMPWSRIRDETGVGQEKIADVYRTQWEAAIVRFAPPTGHRDRVAYQPPESAMLDAELVSRISELIRFRVPKADVAVYLVIPKPHFPAYWAAARRRVRQLAALHTAAVVQGQALLLMAL